MDEGDGTFSITGTATVGNTLSITEDSPDPDGTGTLSYSWQTSSDGLNWQSKSTASSYTVAYNDTGKNIRAVLSYTDGEGFAESVTTSSITISSDLIFRGTSGDNTLDGGYLADTLYGYAGDDTIKGHGGNDKLWAGAGNDLLGGGDGDDILRGGDGDVTLNGAIDTMYNDMAGRHRSRFQSIQIIRTAQLKAGD